MFPAGKKAEILIDFPYRGSEKQWFPTWAQVLDWPTRDLACQHKRLQISPELIRDISSRLICDLWAIPEANLFKTGKPGEYEAKIRNRSFSFFLPYLTQNLIPTQDHLKFTLVAAHLGHAYNWVVIERKVLKDVELVGVTKVNVLKKGSSYR